MPFEPIRGHHGQPRVNCICADCGRSEVVCADHKRGAGVLGQAIPKLQKLGWSFVSKTLRCPSCEAARKVNKVKSKTQQVADKPARREATPSQRREIIGMIEAAYDVERGRYGGADTDDSIAAELGVMPGWVAEIRESFFGPDGRNADMDELTKEIEVFLDGARGRLAKCEHEAQALRGDIDRVKGFAASLEKIKVAVGPRNLMKAR